mgnify:CR=1 FL=1
MGKIIITGSGRAGTSFLVQLLTRLGEDTGFTPGDEPYSEKLRAGCEQYSITNLLNGDANREIITAAPRVLKSPDWALVLKDLLRYGWIEVDHVLIPFRDCEEAARSRLDVGLEWQCIITDDHDEKLADQANIHALALGRTLEACWLFGIPHTVMAFPLLVQNGAYCYERLSRAFELDRKEFQNVFRELARPEQVKWT